MEFEGEIESKKF